jgi:uncharacterized membrane protein
MAVTERLSANPERTWVLTAVAVVSVLALGAVTLPGLVWDRFLWHYFWGPVFADANNAMCAVMTAGGPELVYSGTACAEADAAGRIVAEPGYTFVSEAGYAATLIFMLVGVLYLLRRLSLGERKGLFLALVPFSFFGGALRVVEDANDAAFSAGFETFLSYPLNTFIISPIIYVTVFLVTLGAVLGSVTLERRGLVEGYERPLFAAGSLALAVTVGFLFWFVPSSLVGPVNGAGLYPAMTLVTLSLAAVIAAGAYYAADRFAPVVHEGTGRVGLVVLFGHAVDGVANVLAADWLDVIGVPVEYTAKHPINRVLVGIVEAVQPASVSAVIGTSWLFLVVKIAAALGVLYVFDEGIFEESPRYAVLLLVAILAVGLGPGTRDMLRATFGI